VQAVAISPDGRTVVTGCANGDVQLWDLARRERRGPTLRHFASVRVLAFSPDGQLVAVGTGGAAKDPESQVPHLGAGEVRLWRAATGQPVGAPLRHPMPVWSLAFTPGGRLLLTGCEDGAARFFSVASGAQVGKALQGTGTVTSVAISRDGKMAFASAAGGETARLWDVPPEDRFGRLLLQGGVVTNLAFNPDGGLLLTGTEDGLVRLWDAADSRLLAPLPPVERKVVALDFSPDGRSFLTASYFEGKSSLRVWDTGTRRVRRKLDLDGRKALAAFCPESRTVLLARHGALPCLWDVESDAQPRFVETHQGGPYYHNLALTPDRARFLTGDDDGAWLWDRATCGPIRQFEHGPSRAAKGRGAVWYPQDGGRVLLLSDGSARVRDAATGRDLGPPPFHPLGGIDFARFSPDGGAILTCSKDLTARLWDVRTGKQLGPPPSRDGALTVAFVPGGRLAAGGREGRVVLCDVLPPLEGDPERVRVWVELLTGMELDRDDVMRPLGPEALQERRRRLTELGGPFPNWPRAWAKVVPAAVATA
jgi:WD40 repeat protein